MLTFSANPTYLPQAMFPRFLEHGILNNSLFRTLSEIYQIEIVNLDQDIRAKEASKEASEKFKIKQGKPLLHIYRKYSTNKPDIFIYSSLFCNTEKFAIGNSM